MKTFHATLRALTPYSPGRHHQAPRLYGELHTAYEERTVLHTLHVSNGELYIPPMAFKRALESTARYVSEDIPGTDRETYATQYRHGVMCPDPVLTGVTPDTVRIMRWCCGRVCNHFPVIDAWAGMLRIICVNDIFTGEVIHRHLQLAGMITGIGVWRTENGGLHGQFCVEDFQESEVV